MSPVQVMVLVACLATLFVGTLRGWRRWAASVDPCLI